MGAIVFLIIVLVVIVVFGGVIVMWLWNWLMPDILGLPTIGYWQAMGLTLLTNILTGAGTGGKSK